MIHSCYFFSIPVYICDKSVNILQVYVLVLFIGAILSTCLSFANIRAETGVSLDVLCVMKGILDKEQCQS